jgi:hypothetical protein
VVFSRRASHSLQLPVPKIISYVITKLAGIFWRQQAATAGEPSAAHSKATTKIIMSRPADAPQLTPQFCFNQTALRGKQASLAPPVGPLINAQRQISFEYHDPR